ncbi:MBL fold metallo-hydrolase [candidate division KSB1 bacterium]|nr:MBL fold metallo-hydrolase [candidate division KSB1 bacterium]
MIKKILFGILGLIIVLILYITITAGPDIKNFFTYTSTDLDDNLTVLLGYGGNTVVLSDPDGKEVLIVDTKVFGGAKKLKSHVEALGTNLDVFIVNTHPHFDHTGGNKLFPGATILTGEKDEMIPNESAKIILVKQGEEYPVVIGADTAFVRNVGRAHTYNSLVVYLPKQQLLATGDIIFHHIHPALFREEGTDIDSWINAFNTLAEWQIKTVVPGHGKIADKNAIGDAKEYFVSIRKGLDNPQKLEELKQRYADYGNVPLATSFKNTVKFMKEN